MSVEINFWVNITDPSNCRVWYSETRRHPRKGCRTSARRRQKGLERLCSYEWNLDDRVIQARRSSTRRPVEICARNGTSSRCKFQFSEGFTYREIVFYQFFKTRDFERFIVKSWPRLASDTNFANIVSLLLVATLVVSGRTQPNSPDGAARVLEVLVQELASVLALLANAAATNAIFGLYWPVYVIYRNAPKFEHFRYKAKYATLLHFHWNREGIRPQDIKIKVSTFDFKWYRYFTAVCQLSISVLTSIWQISDGCTPKFVLGVHTFICANLFVYIAVLCLSLALYFMFMYLPSWRKNISNMSNFGVLAPIGLHSGARRFGSRTRHFELWIKTDNRKSPLST